jgi:hypothetical protein
MQCRITDDATTNLITDQRRPYAVKCVDGQLAQEYVSQESEWNWQAISAKHHVHGIRKVLTCTECRDHRGHAHYANTYLNFAPSELIASESGEQRMSMMPRAGMSVCVHVAALLPMINMHASSDCSCGIDPSHGV